MTLSDPSIAPPDDLLLFAPVVSAYRGANGWSAEVQRAFIAALARTGVIAAAARSVGRTPRSAYQLRRRAGDDSGFARAWHSAQMRGGDLAIDKAVAASLEPSRAEVWRRGRHVGWRTVDNTTLLVAALRTLDRREARWAAAGIDATKLLADAMELLDQREKCEASPPAEPRSPRFG